MMRVCVYNPGTVRSHRIDEGCVHFGLRALVRQKVSQLEYKVSQFTIYAGTRRTCPCAISNADAPSRMPMLAGPGEPGNEKAHSNA